MGRYIEEDENGNRYIVDDGADSPSPPPTAESSPSLGPMETFTGGIANLFHGLTFGFGDQILGAGSGLLDYATDSDPLNLNRPLSDYIDNRTTQVESLRKDFAKENPVTGFASEAAGAIQNPINIAGGFGPAETALGRVAQEAGTGAIQGALFGAGNNQDNLLRGALTGGVVGGGLGGIVGAAGEAVNSLPGIGDKLQRASVGIRQSDINKAAKDAPRGAENPLVTAFNNLRDEGVFAGDKSPNAIQERLTERASRLADDLNNTLAAASSQAPTSSPLFTTARNFVNRLRGTDRATAQGILDEEIQALQTTLDQGGTLADWQAAKQSLQGQSRYGTDTSEIWNNIRKRMASDIRQYIEDVADATLPNQAGAIKATNQALSQGERVGDVIERSKNADLARDPESWLRNQFRTSGGFGVPMLLAAASGGGEYGHSGDWRKAVLAGVAGASLGTRTGKYAMGALFRSAPEVVPSVITKAGVPAIIKTIAKQNFKQEPTATSYFKGGQKGVEQYKSEIGSSEEELDVLYKAATTDFRNFAAPSGVVDPVKASRWIRNNENALSALPELKQQLSKPDLAQHLIDRHFQGETPLAQADVDKNALFEYTQTDPMPFLQGLFTSRNPKASIQNTLAYLKQDREAVSGLRRATVDYIKANPAFYGENRDLLQSSNLFTASQVKVADVLYGNASERNDSTLKAIMGIAKGSFLSPPTASPYVSKLEPFLRSLPPEKILQAAEESLSKPELARDLMNKATPKNIVTGVESLFGDEISTTLKGTQPAEASVISKQGSQNYPKQQVVTSRKSFPDPKELLTPPTKGSFQKTSWSPETAARIGVESGDNPWAVSPKGAEGLSQLMPATAEEIATKLGETYRPLRPGMSLAEQQASIDQNIRFGNFYYDELMGRYKNPTLARAAYNAGPGRVDEAIKLAGSERDVNKVLSNLPRGVQKETLPYIKKIMARLITA